jgi:myo-inositol 2-dehydrogenase / D-chiro-inositol 1-dehydrogenase
MLTIAVLGAGSHSRAFHGPALKALWAENPGRYELAAVCDLDRPRAEAYARDFGFRRSYVDWSAMLETERPGAVIAVTPMEQTGAIASQILRMKFPVLIEKPPGIDTAEARQLAAVARETGTPHMVSFNRRFSPAVAKARQWLEERSAERPVRFLSARMLRHKRREESFVAHTGIHLVDTALSFPGLGSPRSVDARRIDTGNAASHLYEARLAFASGAEAEMLFASAVGRVEETYDLFGEDYHVRIEWLSGAVEIFDGGKLSLGWKPSPDDSPAFLNGTLDETRAFLTAVEAGRAMRPSLDEAMESLRVAEVIQGAR